MLAIPSVTLRLLLFALGAFIFIKDVRSEGRIVCYYTNWSVYRPGTAKFNPQNINPYLCTHLIYAFGGFTKDNQMKPFDKYQDIEQGGYAKFTGLKTFNKQLKTMIAIGGWNEASSRFSPLVASPERRQQFIKNILKFLRQNHFDGIDLDWEYPAHREGGKPRDRDNYAQFVQEMRAEFERESQKTGRPRLLITMAVPAGIEYIDKGYDIPKLNKYLDWFNVLTYDFHSSHEPSVNHHAPLYSLEEESEYNYDTELNIDYSIKYYLKAGADRDKLVLGIPTYGRSFTLINEESTDIGAPAEAPGEQGDATREKGYLAYYEICQSIKEDPEWTVVQPNSNAMGPYAYRRNQWVGYDDEAIVRKKSAYVVDQGLGGIMFWAIDNDDFRGTCNGKPYPLIEAAKDEMLSLLGLGINEVSKPGPIKKPLRSRSRDNTSSTRNRIGGTVDEKSIKRPSGGSRKRIQTSSTTSSTTAVPSTTFKLTYAEGSSLYVGGRTTTPPPPTTPDPGSDFKCEEEGFFQHPRDCKKYYWCLDSGPSGLGIVAHQFTCPSGLYFNPSADSCDFARNVPCKTKKSTTVAPITSTTSKTTIARPTSSYTTLRTTTTARTTTTRATRPTTPAAEQEEYEYEDEEEVGTLGDIKEKDAEEDPKVLKELIELIRKVGGIDELEKHLLRKEDGTIALKDNDATPNSPTPASPISKSLYDKVLSRPNTYNSFRNRLTSSTLYRKPEPFITKKVDEKLHDLVEQHEESLKENNGSKYSSVVRNARPRPQNEGLDKLPEFDAFIKEKKTYVTINRGKTKNQLDNEEQEAKIHENEEEEIGDDQEEEEDVEINEKNTKSTYRPITKAKPTYATIRRTRPTVDVKVEEEIDEEKEVEEETVENKEADDVNQEKTYASVNRNRGRSSTETPIAKENIQSIQRYTKFGRSTTPSIIDEEIKNKQQAAEENEERENVRIISNANDATQITQTIPTRHYAQVGRRTTTTTTTPDISTTIDTPTTKTVTTTNKTSATADSTKISSFNNFIESTTNINNLSPYTTAETIVETSHPNLSLSNLNLSQKDILNVDSIPDINSLLQNPSAEEQNFIDLNNSNEETKVVKDATILTSTENTLITTTKSTTKTSTSTIDSEPIRTTDIDEEQYEVTQKSIVNRKYSRIRTTTIAPNYNEKENTSTTYNKNTLNSTSRLNNYNNRNNVNSRENSKNADNKRKQSSELLKIKFQQTTPLSTISTETNPTNELPGVVSSPRPFGFPKRRSRPTNLTQQQQLHKQQQVSEEPYTAKLSMVEVSSNSNEFKTADVVAIVNNHKTQKQAPKSKYINKKTSQDKTVVNTSRLYLTNNLDSLVDFENEVEENPKSKRLYSWRDPRRPTRASTNRKFITSSSEEDIEQVQANREDYKSKSFPVTAQASREIYKHRIKQKEGKSLMDSENLAGRTASLNSNLKSYSLVKSEEKNKTNAEHKSSQSMVEDIEGVSKIKEQHKTLETPSTENDTVVEEQKAKITESPTDITTVDPLTTVWETPATLISEGNENSEEVEVEEHINHTTQSATSKNIDITYSASPFEDTTMLIQSSTEEIVTIHPSSIKSTEIFPLFIEPSALQAEHGNDASDSLLNTLYVHNTTKGIIDQSDLKVTTTEIPESTYFTTPSDNKITRASFFRNKFNSNNISNNDDSTVLSEKVKNVTTSAKNYSDMQKTIYHSRSMKMKIKQEDLSSSNKANASGNQQFFTSRPNIVKSRSRLNTAIMNEDKNVGIQETTMHTNRKTMTILGSDNENADNFYEKQSENDKTIKSYSRSHNRNKLNSSGFVGKYDDREEPKAAKPISRNRGSVKFGDSDLSSLLSLDFAPKPKHINILNGTPSIPITRQRKIPMKLIENDVTTETIVRTRPTRPLRATTTAVPTTSPSKILRANIIQNNSRNRKFYVKEQEPQSISDSTESSIIENNGLTILKENLKNALQQVKDTESVDSKKSKKDSETEKAENESFNLPIYHRRKYYQYFNDSPSIYVEPVNPLIDANINIQEKINDVFNISEEKLSNKNQASDNFFRLNSHFNEKLPEKINNFEDTGQITTSFRRGKVYNEGTNIKSEEDDEAEPSAVLKRPQVAKSPMIKLKLLKPVYRGRGRNLENRQKASTPTVKLTLLSNLKSRHPSITGNSNTIQEEKEKQEEKLLIQDVTNYAESHTKDHSNEGKKILISTNTSAKKNEITNSDIGEENENAETENRVKDQLSHESKSETNQTDILLGSISTKENNIDEDQSPLKIRPFVLRRKINKSSTGTSTIESMITNSTTERYNAGIYKEDKVNGQKTNQENSFDFVEKKENSKPVITRHPYINLRSRTITGRQPESFITEEMEQEDEAGEVEDQIAEENETQEEQEEKTTQNSSRIIQNLFKATVNMESDSQINFVNSLGVAEKLDPHESIFAEGRKEQEHFLEVPETSKPLITRRPYTNLRSRTTTEILSKFPEEEETVTSRTSSYSTSPNYRRLQTYGAANAKEENSVDSLEVTETSKLSITRRPYTILRSRTTTESTKNIQEENSVDSLEVTKTAKPSITSRPYTNSRSRIIENTKNIQEGNTFDSLEVTETANPLTSRRPYTNLRIRTTTKKTTNVEEDNTFDSLEVIETPKPLITRRPYAILRSRTTTEKTRNIEEENTFDSLEVTETANPLTSRRPYTNLRIRTTTEKTTNVEEDNTFDSLEVIETPKPLITRRPYAILRSRTTTEKRRNIQEENTFDSPEVIETPKPLITRRPYEILRSRTTTEKISNDKEDNTFDSLEIKETPKPNYTNLRSRTTTEKLSEFLIEKGEEEADVDIPRTGSYSNRPTIRKYTNLNRLKTYGVTKVNTELPLQEDYFDSIEITERIGQLQTDRPYTFLQPKKTTENTPKSITQKEENKIDIIRKTSEKPILLLKSIDKKLSLTPSDMKIKTDLKEYNDNNIPNVKSEEYNYNFNDYSELEITDHLHFLNISGSYYNNTKTSNKVEEFVENKNNTFKMDIGNNKLDENVDKGKFVNNEGRFQDNQLNEVRNSGGLEEISSTTDQVNRHLNVDGELDDAEENTTSIETALRNKTTVLPKRRKVIKYRRPIGENTLKTNNSVDNRYNERSDNSASNYFKPTVLKQDIETQTFETTSTNFTVPKRIRKIIRKYKHTTENPTTSTIAQNKTRTNNSRYGFGRNSNLDDEKKASPRAFARGRAVLNSSKNLLEQSTTKPNQRNSLAAKNLTSTELNIKDENKSILKKTVNEVKSPNITNLGKLHIEENDTNKEPNEIEEEDEEEYEDDNVIDSSTENDPNIENDLTTTIRSATLTTRKKLIARRPYLSTKQVLLTTTEQSASSHPTHKFVPRKYKTFKSNGIAFTEVSKLNSARPISTTSQPVDEDEYDEYDEGDDEDITDVISEKELLTSTISPKILRPSFFSISSRNFTRKPTEDKEPEKIEENNDYDENDDVYDEEDAKKDVNANYDEKNANISIVEKPKTTILQQIDNRVPPNARPVLRPTARTSTPEPRYRQSNRATSKLIASRFSGNRIFNRNRAINQPQGVISPIAEKIETLENERIPSLRPNKISPFKPTITRSYERKYTIATTETIENSNDTPILEDLNVEALNARNKKIFENNKKLPSLKPKLQTKSPQEAPSQNDTQLNTENDTDTDNNNTPLLSIVTTTPINNDIVNNSSVNEFSSQDNIGFTTQQTPTTTLLHIFTLFDDMSTSPKPPMEEVQAEEGNMANPRLLTEEPKHKVVEINRIVEITSKEDKLRRKTNNHKEVLEPIGTSSLKVVSLPHLEQLGEISVIKFVHQVDGKDIVVDGHSTVADYTPTEATFRKNSVPVRNSIPSDSVVDYLHRPFYLHAQATESSPVYRVLTERYGKALLPEVIREAVETSTLSLEGLFDNARNGKKLNLIDESDIETSTIGTPIEDMTSEISKFETTIIPDDVSANIIENVGTSTESVVLNTIKSTTVSNTLFQNYVRPLVPLLRPESNESLPIVISIANLDKVILSKVNKTVSFAKPTKEFVTTSSTPIFDPTDITELFETAESSRSVDAKKVENSSPIESVGDKSSTTVETQNSSSN